jgi:hypothetical protein
MNLLGTNLQARPEHPLQTEYVQRKGTDFVHGRWQVCRLIADRKRQMFSQRSGSPKIRHNLDRHATCCPTLEIGSKSARERGSST